MACGGVCLLLALASVYGQSGTTGVYYSGSASSVYAHRLRSGVNLYRESRWHEALNDLRIAQDEAINDQQVSEALYWIMLAQLGVSDFEAALGSMDLLERFGGVRLIDSTYHRGRTYYYLGRFDEAVTSLTEYIEKAGAEDKARVSAAYYWVGECFLSLGQFERAAEYFRFITEHHNGSAKYEAAVYRLSLINQKKVELELLDMIRWSHEEALKASEEYQRRERMYDQALNAYQRQIAEYQQENRFAGTEAANADYRRQLEEARNRIASLERRLGVSPDTPDAAGGHNELLDWAMQLRQTMYEILLQQPDIEVLYSLSSRLDQFITGENSITEEELAAMELTITLLKAQYNIPL
jgi:tetratricopeptide (TPR) repeat protein